METDKRTDFFRRMRQVRAAYGALKELRGDLPAYSVTEEGSKEEMEALIRTRLPQKSLERIKKHGTTAEKMAYFIANMEMKGKVEKRLLTTEEEQSFLNDHAEGKALKMRDKLLSCYMKLQKVDKFVLSAHKTSQIYTERVLLFFNRFLSWLSEWRQRENTLLTLREELLKEGHSEEDFTKIRAEIDKKEKTLTDLSEGAELWEIVLTLCIVLTSAKRSFKSYVVAIDEFLAENKLERNFLPYITKVCFREEEEEGELNFAKLPKEFRRSYINDLKEAGEEVSEEEEAIAIFPDLREVSIKESLYESTKSYLEADL